MVMSERGFGHVTDVTCLVGVPVGRDRAPAARESGQVE